MPFCTACGTQNPDDARFCAQCGTRLRRRRAAPAGDRVAGESTATITFGAAATRPRPPTGSSARSTPPPSTRCPRATPCSSCSAGPGAGSRFLLDTDVVNAGRHPDSEIFLDDVTVSRRHAEFHRTGDGFTVSDVGSLNGTYVNRDRIDEVLLNDGDEVQIGKYRLVFFSGARGRLSP